MFCTWCVCCWSSDAHQQLSATEEPINDDTANSRHGPTRAVGPSPRGTIDHFLLCNEITTTTSFSSFMTTWKRGPLTWWHMQYGHIWLGLLVLKVAIKAHFTPPDETKQDGSRHVAISFVEVTFPLFQELLDMQCNQPIYLSRYWHDVRPSVRLGRTCIVIIRCTLARISVYTVFQKKTPTHIVGYKLRNSCLILIIFDIEIPDIIWHRMTA